MNDCRLTPDNQYVSYITMKTSYSRCDDHDSLSWIFILQAHQRNRPQVDTQTHPDTLTQFRANKSLFLLLDVAGFAEKQLFVLTPWCCGLCWEAALCSYSLMLRALLRSSKYQFCKYITVHFPGLVQARQ